MVRRSRVAGRGRCLDLGRLGGGGGAPPRSVRQALQGPGNQVLLLRRPWAPAGAAGPSGTQHAQRAASASAPAAPPCGVEDLGTGASLPSHCCPISPGSEGRERGLRPVYTSDMWPRPLSLNLDSPIKARPPEEPEDSDPGSRR